MARMSKAGRWQHLAAPTLTIILATFALTGCYSRLTGNEGKFTFGYLVVSEEHGARHHVE